MTKKILGFLLILFPIAVQVPFVILTNTFNYPDVLRQDPGIVLAEFQATGSSLVWTWYTYAMAIFIFLAANIKLYRLVPRENSTWLLSLGLASGFIQLIALLRWVFLVPILAKMYAGADSESSRELLRLIFDLQNSFIGIGLGEHLGQATMAAWSICLAVSLNKNDRRLRWLGFASATLLFAGLSEHLTYVFGSAIPHLDKVAALGFVLWSIWMFGIGFKILRMKNSNDVFTHSSL